MLTKTQIKIMIFFTGNIKKVTSIRQLGRDLNISYPLIHRSITPLIRLKYLIIDENKLIKLNYAENHYLLSYIEGVRANELLNKNYASPIAKFLEEILDKFEHEYFIIILFGSAVESKKPRDYDILFVFENNKIANQRERAIDIISSNYSEKFDIQLIGTESVFEMASKRNQKNLLNELLNKHIILYGAENFYRLLKHARQ